MAGALRQLVLARTREFFREPEAIFWVYVFPIILMFGLGLAFRGGPAKVAVDIVEGPEAARAEAALLEGKSEALGELTIHRVSAAEARRRYGAGKADLIVEVVEGGYRFTLDPSRTEARSVRALVEDALQRAAGRKDPRTVENVEIQEPGSRYIDWLIPGLLGMNIMGGGLWGLGFVTVDFRMRKLLKRFIATPMRRGDFLLSLIASRLLFLIPEAAVILSVGHLAFGLECKGSWLSVISLSLLGALSFSGLGLLIACRTDKIEVISGLLNVIILPMWLFSGVFFSADRFPEALQPFTRALPLTQLNDALRAVILDGAGLASQWLPASVLLGYGAVSYVLALRWFRWR